MIHNKEEISSRLILNSERIADWMKAQPSAAFEKGPEGKWTSGQHLDHLIKSVKPLNQAFLLPKIIFRGLFGKPDREGRNYEALVERYHSKLQGGGIATGRFVPPEIKIEEKQALLDTFIFQYKKLATRTSRLSEKALDAYLLPHPLLGKLTIREMLFFTVYHLEHHFRILDEKYEK